MPSDSQRLLDLPEGERTFDFEQHLTVGALMQIEKWYPEIGAYLPFETSFDQGQANAVACAVWLARKAEGSAGIEPPRNPDIAALPLGKTAIAPNRREGATGPRPWRAVVDGEEVTLDLDAVTVRQFRQFDKDFPGRGLGSYNGLLLPLWQGMPQAILCAVWAAHDLARTPCPRPKDIDPTSIDIRRTVYDNLPEDDDAPEAEVEDVPKSTSETRIDSTGPSDTTSTEAPENSGDSGSPPSATTATSEPES